MDYLFHLRNYRRPGLFFAQEALWLALFVALVIRPPLVEALESSGMDHGMAALMAGAVGFLLFWLMERTWKLYGPVRPRG